MIEKISKILLILLLIALVYWAVMLSILMSSHEKCKSMYGDGYTSALVGFPADVVCVQRWADIKEIQ